MNELERRLRATAHADSTAAASASASRDTHRAIARRRGLTSGAVGAAAAVLVGTVAFVGLDQRGDNIQPPGPTPSLDLTGDDWSRSNAVVPLPDGDYPLFIVQPLVLDFCGEPAPQPLTEEGDFSGDFDIPSEFDFGQHMPGTVADGPRADAVVTHHGHEPVPAFAGDPTALFVQDGTVVGAAASLDRAALSTFDPDESRTYSWHWTGWVENCDVGMSPQFLPAGDYEIVFVSRIFNDQTAAARESLRRDNFSLPGAAELEAFREGSHLCDRWEMWHVEQPITCRPNAVVGFELDEGAGTATIPYDTSLYSHDIDVTFASDPVPVSLGEPPHSAAHISSIPNLADVGELTCGETYSYFGDGEQNPLSATWPTRSTLPSRGDHIGAELWVQLTRWQSAQVDTPDNPRIWIFETERVADLDAASGVETTVSFTGYTIVGWLDTESANSTPVDIDVYTGPAAWPLTVADSQWCDGFEASDDRSPAAVDMGLTGLITAPSTVTLDGDSAHNATVMWLRPDLFN